MEQPWSDGVYTSDVPRDFEEVRIREDRKERIGLHWDLLVADQEPKVHKQALLLLMQDLKDEGNILFKEGDYDVSWMHYRNALFIARILESRFYHEVDKEFISTLFSNRAFCCLKKEMYVEAIQDCDSAIQIFPGNVKAYYRQVLALKAQKRLNDALSIAEKGLETKPGVFKELVDELKELIAADKKSASASARDSRNVSRDAPDSDWLIGTNVDITKQSELQRSKMPSKKSKGKTNGKQPNVGNTNTQKTDIKQTPSRSNGVISDHAESDSDQSEDRLSEDENFANNFINVRNAKLTGHSMDFHLKFPTVSIQEKNANFPSMGLDSFSPPAGKSLKPDLPQSAPSASSSASSLSSRTSTPVSKTSSRPVSSEVKNLQFPLADNYEWFLACRLCFIKLGEGVRGFKYVKDTPHHCSHSILLVRLKKKEGMGWIKVRPRPEPKFQQFGGYKICSHFNSGNPCAVGEEKCTFAHNKAEQTLWNMERENLFSVAEFIEKLQRHKIDTSEELATLQKLAESESRPSSSSSNIPGLNYKPKQQQLSPAPAQPAPPQPPPQQTPTTPVRAPYQPLLPTPARPPTPNLPAAPIMNRPRMTVPMYGYQETGYNYMPMNHPPPPLYGQNSGMPAPGMPRYPPPNMMRNRFPSQKSELDVDVGSSDAFRRRSENIQVGAPAVSQFQAPTSQQQIRPNLMKAPAPKPVADSTYEDYYDGQTEHQLDFPLSKTHEYRLLCKNCYKYIASTGMYVYQPIQHKCEENIMVVKLRQGNAPLRRIRERKNHRVFTGRYIMCNSIKGGVQVSLCRYGEDNCSFAHNEEEQKLWTMEKDEEFNITEFIIQSRSKNLEKGFSLTDVLSKHSGYLSFICKACFYNTPQMINREGADEKCSGKAKHDWSDYRILAHFSHDGKVTVINPRGFLHKTAFFKVCKWLHFCRNRINAECRFAHSMVERDLWMLERDTGFSQEQIVELANEYLGIATPETATEMKSNTLEITPSATFFQAPAQAPQTPQATRVVQKVPEQKSAALEEDDDLCPYIIQELCLTCWKNGKKSIQDGTKDRCVKSHSNWNTNRVYLISPSNKEIRPLPRKIPAGFKFILCSYIEKKGKCGYTGGGPCQFAHCQEELEIWQWMCVNDIKKVEDLFKASKEAQNIRAAQTKNKVISGESVVSVTKRVALPTQVKFSMHYCSYCGKQCNSQKQWDEHCASEKHNFNVNSDKEHQWNHRQPPWGMPGTSYELCYKHIESKCPYSNVPDMYNLCQYAHSEEELDEWRERYEWRQMKREMARQEKVFSFMDELLEQYQAADAGIKVISDELNNVIITCEQELTIYEEEKNAVFLWTFNVQTKRSLERVALLYNKDRLHFSLIENNAEKNTQIAQGSSFAVSDGYRVEVQFSGTMFGSFNQWVIFDFGTLPVMVRKLFVEVGTLGTHEKVKSLREKLQFDRWTAENCEIIRYEGENVDELEQRLLNRYKAPSSSESVISQHSVATELNCNNYQHKMHKLLEMEEMSRHQIISSYNLRKCIEILKVIQESSYVYPQNGELFARVPLAEYLTEDTDAGKLILTSVRKVLIAPLLSPDNSVYEGVIVRKDNFDYDGRGKEYIYLCLSRHCVRGLQLSHGMTMEVEIQFQMDRMSFCMMHFAVDQLASTDVVFPDISKITSLNDRTILKVNSQILNPDQIQAVQHIVADRVGYNPPFVIYGPFGTGKTETIAQAVMVLLKEKPESRILICAQSNSAADLYITKHLDPFLRKTNQSQKIRRVYFKERRVNTVVPEVRKYCLLNADNTAFEFPSHQDITKHNIVIATLATSLLLTELDLSHYFTHIFVDEAAQALEAEAIMPLSLATEKTCIVLAGDHKQISPKVYSHEAREQKFDMSLLERLFQYYDSYSHKIDPTKPLNILLRINYRTKMEILRFISSIFYGGPENLESRANLPSVLEITPLMFYAVQGVEIQDADSISFYNMSEVQEVVERVQELYNMWPVEWGERNAKAIGVVTPYYDQVQLIRKALRKKHRDLGLVTVERVNNVQGKEFRALFVSTVRTRGLIDSPNVNFNSECEGDGGDYGFLSDSKLLNTALTRAQSYVAVVGDPVALCAIGECLNVWRTYLKHCQNMKSIHPPTLSLESIKQQVSTLAQSPQRNRLTQSHKRQAELAPAPLSNPQSAVWNKPIVKEETNESPSPLKPLPIPSNVIIKGNDSPQRVAPITNKSNPPSIEIGSKITLSQSAPKVNYTHNLQQGQQISADVILTQLMEQLLQLEKKQLLQKQAELTGHKLPADIVIQLDQPVYKELIDFREKEGFVEMCYKSEKSTVQEEFSHMQLYSESHLRALISKQPDQFKQCLFHMTGDKMYADVIDLGLGHINIGNILRCGTAVDGDKVVVEILPSDDEDDLDMDNMDLMHQGQVVGILNRKINPENRSFVCRVDEENPGIMIPINSGIHKMYHLSNNNEMDKISIYEITKDNKVMWSQSVGINPITCSNMLFIVRFIQWHPKLYFPIGLTVGVVPVGTNILSSLKILDLEYDVKKHFNSNTVHEIQNKFSSNFTIPIDEFSKRLDLRNKWTFSIASESAEHISHALSIEETNEGFYVMGVHVSDVAYFVKLNSSIDIEAKSRAASVNLPKNECLNMLPKELSSDLCSIKPDVDRLTLSVFITVSKSGEISHVQPHRCIVNSKKNFSYTEVEQILHDPNAASDYLSSCMVVLYHISRIWRRQRLGNASMYQDMDVADKLSSEAHMMIQELMVVTNQRMAMFLLQKYPDRVPLYCQKPPDQADLENWRREHAVDAINSIALTKPFLEGNKICVCKVACTCIHSYVRTKDLKVRDSFDIYQGLWQALCEGADMRNMAFVQTIIVAAESHPQLAVALMKLYSIQKQSFYICSGDKTDYSHYSLNLSPYVHFVNPICRYMDIIIHRMIIAAIEGSTPGYSRSDIQHFCENFTNLSTRLKEYEKTDHLVHLAFALKSKPLVVYPVIENVSEEHVVLCFPTLKGIPDLNRMIKLDHLSVAEAPRLFEGGIQLRWQECIYDLKAQCEEGVPNMLAELNPDQYVFHVPSFQWQKLLYAVRDENQEKLLTTVQSVREQIRNPAQNQKYASQITAEKTVNGKILPFADFILKMNKSAILQVQVAAGISNGIIAPIIQLVRLMPNLDICVEHRCSPHNCFSRNSVPMAFKDVYQDENDYVDSWLRVLNIEAAATAVSDGEIILIRNVYLQWQSEMVQNNQVYTATMNLPLDFCINRNIKFPSHAVLQELFDPENVHVAESYFLDYVCVRYMGLNFAGQKELDKSDALLFDSNVPVCWVGHCVITSVSRNERDLKLKLQLHQSSVEPPIDLLRQQINKMPCTMEWISKTVESRKVDCAVRSLSSSSQLSRDIALGNSHVPLVDYRDVELLRQFPAPGLPNPNGSQDHALSMAMRLPFTVITGSAGTGKSVTAARLIYMLSLRNKMVPVNGKKPQIMVCAASEKSLDVIVGLLTRLGQSCPKLLRVYDEKAEQQEYALPRRDTAVRTGRMNLDISVLPINDNHALHHKIRLGESTFANSITEFDMLFQLYPDDISDQQIEEYLKAIKQAEAVELCEAEILLCTCSTSADQKLKQNCNINQVVIDDCGMLTEPECMIPIVTYDSAKQVVLLGNSDHVAPTVRSSSARKLGLGKSIIERYIDKAVILQTQYRMHEDLAEISSGFLCKRKLELGTEEQMVKTSLFSNDKPVTFCQVRGKEDKVTNGQGIVNQEEITLVVAIASKLVNRHRIAEESLVILSFYHSQCSAITKKLQQKGHKNITVCTPEESQGNEWDFVIISTVRSLPRHQVELRSTSLWKQDHLGLVGNHGQLSVALSRARKHIMVLGNDHLLNCDAMWEKFLKLCKEKGQVVDGRQYLKWLT